MVSRESNPAPQGEPKRHGGAKGAPGGVERRRYRRIPAKLGLKVKVLDEPRPLPLREAAVTETVSPGDLYFHSTLYEHLRVGSRLEIEIDLPVAAGNLFSGRYLLVRGQVVRFGDHDAENPARRGVAVRFLSTPRFVGEFD